MVRDPSIVSPSLAGCVYGGGHNKHDTGPRCTLLKQCRPPSPSSPWRLGVGDVGGGGGVTDAPIEPSYKRSLFSMINQPSYQSINQSHIRSEKESVGWFLDTRELRLRVFDMTRSPTKSLRSHYEVTFTPYEVTRSQRSGFAFWVFWVDWRACKRPSQAMAVTYEVT